MKGRQEQHTWLVWRSVQLKQNGAAKMAQAFNIMLGQARTAHFTGMKISAVEAERGGQDGPNI